VVGDDLTVTSPERIARAVDLEVAAAAVRSPLPLCVVLGARRLCWRLLVLLGARLLASALPA
jgi:hypothetical protein